ncbi:MAG: sigma-54-dependent Fis family transcriptional regulator [Planctomycetia bacterium]|nr:sigma-54-dependent Fis family transcriptional regulator [Planctomycetia bacterium]
MRIFHFNDEEKDLHRYLAERSHANVILPADADPFAVAAREPFDAAFVGLHPHGLELIRTLRERNPDCCVTIITSDRNTRMAVEAMKRGAFDYLLSPLDFTEVERTCILMAREQELLDQRRRLQDQLALVASSSRLVGSAEPIENLRRLVAKAAVTRAPVLLLGETGTGKELVARLLHEQSPRRDKALVNINCSAIPPSLLESELFGYRKGAFTGADSDRDGLLAQADGGTCFFDEVQDLDPTLQGKILRVVQEGEILPLGARRVVRLDVRFVTATNADLPELVRQRRFREDLFYRLNVVPIFLPPLRDHLEDVPVLVRHFLDLYCRREGRAPLKVSPAVWRWLNSHPWPGNVRELENLCQRAVALTDGDTFDIDVLALTGSLGEPPLAATAATGPSRQLYRASRDGFDRRLLEQALADCSGNVSRAAEALGVSRTTFYARARRLDLALPRPRGRA